MTIYAALIVEVFENGCTRSTKLINCILLMQTNSKIRIRICLLHKCKDILILIFSCFARRINIYSLSAHMLQTAMLSTLLKPALYIPLYNRHASRDICVKIYLILIFIFIFILIFFLIFIYYLMMSFFTYSIIHVRKSLVHRFVISCTFCAECFS